MNDVSNLVINQTDRTILLLEKNSQADKSRLVVHPTEGVAHDDAQHQRGDCHIEPILFHDEVKQRQRHARHGSEDEHNNAHLYATRCVTMENALPQTIESRDVRLRCSGNNVKMTIVGHRVQSVLQQVIDAPNTRQKTSQNNAPTQGVADELLDIHIVCSLKRCGEVLFS